MSDTAHPRIKYLHAHRGGFLYRRRIPAKLTWAFEGRAVLEIPLPKVPPAELAKLVAQHNAAFERTVASARAGRGADGARPLRDSDIPVVAQAWEALHLQTDEEHRDLLESDADFDAEEALAAQALEQRKRERARNRLEVDRPEVEHFLEGAGLAPPEDPGLLRKLLSAILEADQRAAQAAVARYQGEVVRTPPVPLGPGVYEGEGVAGAHGYFDEMYRLWVRRSGSTHVSRNEAEVWLRRLADFTKTDPSAFMETLDAPRPVSPDVRGRRLHLSNVPRSKVMAFKDHWLEVAEQHARTGKGPRMSAKTVRKGLSMLGAVVGTSLHEHPADDKLQLNVFHHLWRKNERKADGVMRPRTAFEVEQLNLVFGSRLYAQGPDPYDPMEVAMYWLMLAGTFTGARLEELAHLEPWDIRDVNGRWWMRIEAKSRTQRVKTAVSLRDVPLHRTLIDAGFVSYALAARKAGWKRLFPWLTETKRGGVAAAVSKKLNRYLDAIGLDDRRLVFHSSRHAFKHFARMCDIQTEAVDALVGHSGKSGAAGMYGADQFPRQALLRAIDQFDIPGLNLDAVLAPEDAGGAHVALVQAAIARGKTKTGKWRGPSRLPSFLQPLAANRVTHREAA